MVAFGLPTGGLPEDQPPEVVPRSSATVDCPTTTGGWSGMLGHEGAEFGVLDDQLPDPVGFDEVLPVEHGPLEVLDASRR